MLVTAAIAIAAGAGALTMYSLAAINLSSLFYFLFGRLVCLSRALTADECSLHVCDNFGVWESVALVQM